MRFTSLLVLMGGVLVSQAAAQDDCLTAASLLKLDAEWERALLELDSDRLDSLLASDFVWVHNHASLVDTKTAVLDRAQSRRGTSETRSRVSSDVEVRILGSTGVTTGFTVVDRGPTPTRFNFMRTYAEVGGRCLLLANHTMAIPDE